MVGDVERGLPPSSLLLFCSLLIGTSTAYADGNAASFCAKMSQQNTPKNYSTLLQAEVKSYEQSAKFRNKIAELNGRKNVDWDGGRIGEIATELRKVVDKSVYSILELGAGPGLITRYAQQLAAKAHSSSGPVRVDGVELVAGWVRCGTRFCLNEARQGDPFPFPTRRHHKYFTWRYVRSDLHGGLDRACAQIPARRALGSARRALAHRVAALPALSECSEAASGAASPAHTSARKCGQGQWAAVAAVF